MGLPLYALRSLKPYLKGAEVLSLSYPDILVSPEDMKENFGFEVKRITNQNRRHHVNFQLPETRDVFDFFEVKKLDCVDIAKTEGSERVVDLNYPNDLGKYDVIIDPGTLEHCFNIGQAFMNCANAVKTGGIIFHLSPVNMMNHGFYNLCPTVFYDFYTQNGWTVEVMEMLNGNSMKYDPTARFFLNLEYLVGCIAKRRSGAALKYPTQTKYLLMEASKAA